MSYYPPGGERENFMLELLIVLALCWLVFGASGCALFTQDPYRDPCEVRWCEKVSKYDRECAVERCMTRAELERMLRVPQ